MTPQEYDAWYDAPRGKWIGEREYRLAASMLALPAGASLLDLGCGTGWFGRRFAGDGYAVTGVDPDASSLAFARERMPGIRYLAGDATNLPFPDNAFDGVVCITVLNFVDDPQRAAAELVRVCRHCFVVGVLNRWSLLYQQKGRGGGTGGYAGAHWFTARELRGLFTGLPVGEVDLRSTVFLPSAGGVAQWLEPRVPACLPFGSLILISGSKVLPCRRTGE
ncbi:MAG: class I SAM-dependent methyltransferase [Pseudomonadota bacterium]